MRETLGLDEQIAIIGLNLDAAAFAEFGLLAQLSLKRAMERCGMNCYPQLVGDPDGERVSGLMICQLCGEDYYHHPLDWRVSGYGNVPCLRIVCDGRRVKL